jgi:hypothetical protein
VDSEEKKLDTEEIKRLASQARELKDDPAFAAAVLALRKQYHGQQMIATSRDAMADLALRMQTLEGLAAQLQVFINDWTWAEKRKH